MSQDRILGSAARLEIYNPAGGPPIHFAELDSFTAKNKEELKEWHPLGQVQPHGQLVYGGYEFTFKGAKVNGDWDAISAANDLALLSGKPAPRYRIVETTNLYDGSVEQYVYNNCLIHGFNVDKNMANEEIKQDFSGFAPTRTNGSFSPDLGLLSGGPVGNLA